MSGTNNELSSRALVESLPPHVLLVAAAKARSVEELQTAPDMAER